MIELVGLLTLDCLIDFGGCEPPDFMPYIFDLSPRQVDRRAFLAVLFLAD